MGYERTFLDGCAFLAAKAEVVFVGDDGEYPLLGIDTPLGEGILHDISAATMTAEFDGSGMVGHDVCSWVRRERTNPLGESVFPAGGWLDKSDAKCE